jgi:hypothetical protein
MTHFDYAASAELFFGAPARNRKMSYRRFDTAVDAIAFAIEELDPASLNFATLEVNEVRFDRHAIRRLYEAAEYPRPRETADA